MSAYERETTQVVAREYKGVSLEGLDKKTSMAHSRFFEKDEGVEWFDALLARDKSSLSPEQFQAISALNSVANMNYQICNGGLIQYFDNGYDRERAPFNADDVKQVDKANQVEMLRELHALGQTVFPEKELENERLDRIISDFESSHYEEETESWYSDEENEYGEYAEEEGGFVAPYDFDRRYYETNGYLETLIEAYAQYLDKSIEMELDRGGKETFYFSFGTSDFFPFKLGWVEVQAEDRMEACEMYASHYPRRDGLLNCAFVYNEGEWRQSGLGGENLGHCCHRVIKGWGPFTEKNLPDVPSKDGRTEKSLDDLIREAREKATDRNGSCPDPDGDREAPSQKNTDPER